MRLSPNEQKGQKPSVEFCPMYKRANKKPLFGAFKQKTDEKSVFIRVLKIYNRKNPADIDRVRWKVQSNGDTRPFS